MKKQFQLMSFLGILALLLSVSSSLNAQQSSQQTDPAAQQSAPSQPAQPSQTPDESQRPAPDSQAQTAPAADHQVFTGTIVKSGDKYVLQDEASGKSYDLDQQDKVSEFAGKRVRVHGTLDANGKMIHVQ